MPTYNVIERQKDGTLVRRSRFKARTARAAVQRYNGRYWVLKFTNTVTATRRG